MAIYGAEPYGPGTPAVAPALGGKTLTDPSTGQQLGSRKIDPTTGQYVIDPSTGRIAGMTNAQQLVYLATRTRKGSSALQGLGQTLADIERIGAGFEKRVDTILRDAVQTLVDRGIITVDSVDVQKVKTPDGRTVVFVNLRWRDVSTGQPETTLVSDS